MSMRQVTSRYGSAERETVATEATRDCCSGMLRLLNQAASHPTGHVSIERAREGTWPGELHYLRKLERNGLIRFIATRDRRAERKVLAVYAITPEGRKAAAAARRLAS
jgi:hypothetical protein